jgi:hypothetical protein
MKGWLLAGILALPTAAAAQPAGTISGLALDQTGAALPGVVVSVRGLDVRQTAVTDAAGRYGVPGLAAGEYEVTASLINFVTASARDVVVRGARPRMSISGWRCRSRPT